MIGSSITFRRFLQAARPAATVAQLVVAVAVVVAVCVMVVVIVYVFGATNKRPSPILRLLDGTSSE